MRRRLLEAGAIAERPLTLDDLAAAHGLLLLNSLIGALPVGRVEGVERAIFGGGGELAARLRARA